MTHQSNIIKFRRKLSASERINNVLNVLCITLSLACIALSLLILGSVLF